MRGPAPHEESTGERDHDGDHQRERGQLEGRPELPADDLGNRHPQLVRLAEVPLHELPEVRDVLLERRSVEPELGAHLSDPPREERLVVGRPIQVLAAPAADEGAQDAPRARDGADQHAEQVQLPRRDVIRAAARELPRRDLEFAERVGAVRGEDVVQIVESHGAHARRRIGEWHRHRSELEIDPRVGIPAVGPEAIAGFALFSGKAQCASCHPPPLYTDQRYHRIGLVRSADEGRGRVDSSGQVIGDDGDVAHRAFSPAATLGGVAFRPSGTS